MPISEKYTKDELEKVTEYLALSMMYMFESAMDSGDIVSETYQKGNRRTLFINERKKFAIGFQEWVYTSLYYGSEPNVYYPHLLFYVKGKEYIYPFPTKGLWIFKNIDTEKTVYKKYKELTVAFKSRVDELKEEEIKKVLVTNHPE